MPEANPSSPMSTDKADILPKANHQNPVKKVHAGRILSAGEVHLLQAMQAGGRPDVKTFASTQAGFADLLRVSRRTVQRGEMGSSVVAHWI